MDTWLKLRISLFCTLCVIGFHDTAGQTVCSPDQIQTSLDTCLQEIRTVAQDNARFTYGTDYETICASPVPDSIQCYNPYSTRNNSMADILFGPGNFMPNTLTDYLNVAFISEPGSYSGDCNHRYSRDTQLTFSLDPSSSQSYTPWDVREEPEMSWSHNDTKQYTLIVQETGMGGYVYGVYINIPYGDVTQGDAIKQYNGSQNFRSDVNPCVFMLYEQTLLNITLSVDWINSIGSGGLGFKVFDFANDNSMTGPIAMNWILTDFDAYSLQQMGPDFVENCASLVETDMKANHQRPFIPTDTELQVQTSVMFVNQPLTFSYCCEDYDYIQRTFFLDPLSNDIMEAAEVRTGNPLQLYVNMNKMSPNASVDFTGKKYTVITVDPDVASASVGSTGLPFLHWLGMNAQVNNSVLQIVEEMPTWNGPLPPEYQPHEYYFLLYEQMGNDLVFNDTIKYAGNCSENLIGRCLFNVTLFAKDNNLRLVGASWLKTENDHFVSHITNVPESEYCPNSLPCDDTGSATKSMIDYSLTAILMLLVCYCNL